ncbi:MAG TPA: [dimethylamine--corrinoid protein] Co-methyltransferase [Methanosarcina sp.]|nr:[dimethylamine--corrinoid protein] Co-methyltransferase [Methanosarcina sp.]
MSSTYHTRMGDGRRIEMTKEELKKDIEAGASEAAKKIKVPDLTDNEKGHLLEIFTAPERVVSVSPEDLIVMSTDVGPDTIHMNYSEFGGVGVPVHTVTANMIAERVVGHDCVMNTFRAGNFKGTSVSIIQVQQDIENLVKNSIAPSLYVGMPNFGAYYKPDGPFDNVGDLISKGKVEEGLKIYEDIIPACKHDISWVAEMTAQVGVDGINIDTAAAGGDGEFLASLQATEEIKEKTEMSVLLNMANHFVLGMHGGIKYDGQTLGNMMPHQQVKVAEKAGVDIFGPVVNTNTKKSVAWNVARAVTAIKECSRVANIPIHPNLGMGVCGAPMVEIPPIDAVSRAAKALVEIGRADGI